MRRISRQVVCGGVVIGGGAPVAIQSMTNTDTRDVRATADQIRRLEEAGCEIVRVSVPDQQAADALKEIRKFCRLPLVADIHFDYRLAVESIRNGADKIRINPGNIGAEENVSAVVKAAKERRIPIRIGVNSGSIERDLLKKYGGPCAEGLAESALRNVQMVRNMGFEDIVLSAKASDAVMNYQAHLLIADKTDCPLHIGVTESGTPSVGIVKSAAGLGGSALSGNRRYDPGFSDSGSCKGDSGGERDSEEHGIFSGRHRFRILSHLFPLQDRSDENCRRDHGAAGRHRKGHAGKKTAASESGCHGMCSQRSGRSFGRRFRYRLRRWKGRLFSRRKDRKDRGGRGNHRSGDI